ncbi:MAG: hypothetical protein P4L85_01825 [Paludisphaera borealis]|uniref:hypothetical protein n=1 Tax=Paludisphaera borealis TaxID=1387353 RepID=UPI00283F1AE3|nr:hypothetical protein [Paludisphaera borealis]MDR3618059.1 hypothetical protein [Paludisphaera borealis]
MSHRLMKHALMVLSLLLGSAEFARSEAQRDEKAMVEEFRALAKEEAASYTFRLEGSDRPLRLRPESVLSYVDPVVGGVCGDVFIGTAEGRPEVVAAIYRFYARDPHRGAAFDSMSLGKLTAERDGDVVWSPAKPGVELKPIPGAPAPADSAAGRLRQMRALAREFTSRQTNRAGVDSAMRVLSQPLYRYEGTKGDLIDGGLFVFVHGGAPEIFMLIEARRMQDGTSEWRFGANRPHGIDLRLYHRGDLIWRAPEIPWSQIIDPREPYWGFRVDMPGLP